MSDFFKNRKDRTDGMRPEVADVYYSNEIYNSWAFQQNKEFIKFFDDNLKPNTVIDTDIQKQTGKTSDEIQGIINSDLNYINSIIRFVMKLDTTINDFDRKKLKDDIESKMDKLLSYSNLVKKFNDIIREYNDIGINNNTRDIIKTNIQKLGKNVDLVIYGLIQLITNLSSSDIGTVILYIKLKDDGTIDLPPDSELNIAQQLHKKNIIIKNEINKSKLLQLIKMTCVYLQIQNNLFTNYYTDIDDIQIESQYPNLLKNFGVEIRNYINKFINEEITGSKTIIETQKNIQMKQLIENFISENGYYPSLKEQEKLRLKLPNITYNYLDKIRKDYLLYIRNLYEEYFNSEGGIKNIMTDYLGRPTSEFSFFMDETHVMISLCFEFIDKLVKDQKIGEIDTKIFNFTYKKKLSDELNKPEYEELKYFKDVDFKEFKKLDKVVRRQYGIEIRRDWDSIQAQMSNFIGFTEDQYKDMELFIASPEFYKIIKKNS